MEHKTQTFSIKGMQRDLAVSKFSPEFAFENMNIRITSRDHQTLLAVTNEKGNKKINILDINTQQPLIIKGDYLGYATLNKTLVLFLTTSEIDKPDYIYKLDVKSANTFSGELLYNGNLGFSTDNPIETLTYYEAEKIQKVYWVDGKNQPRVINIVADLTLREQTWGDTAFDFLPIIIEEGHRDPKVQIERATISGGGSFPAGTVQYVFTYFNMFGQESNIYYTSPQFYTGFKDRAASPEETSLNTFKLLLNQYSPKHFTYYRIYSIVRTSLDSMPIVKIVADLKINKEDPTNVPTFIDTNTSGEIISPNILLFIGGKELFPSTIQTKDNHLFLGNYNIASTNFIEDSLKEEIKTTLQSHITTTLQDVTYSFPIEGVYSEYRTTEDLLNKITYLRKDNYYRIGISLGTALGTWTDPIHIIDYKGTLNPKTIIVGTNIEIFLPTLQIQIPEDLWNKLEQKGFINVKPLIVYPNPTERTILYQGLLCSTVFNLKDRANNNPFVQSSWFMRPAKSYIPQQTDHDNKLSYILAKNNPCGMPIECNHYHQIPPYYQWGSEIQNTVDEFEITRNAGVSIDEILKFNHSNYYIDTSILTFHSPDIINSPPTQKEIEASVEIVGISYLNTYYYDCSMLVGGTVQAQQVSTIPYLQDVKKIGETIILKESTTELGASPLWDKPEIDWKDKNIKEFVMIYPWHKSGATYYGQHEEGGTQIVDHYNILKNKKMSVLRNSFHNVFLDSPFILKNSSLKLFNSQETTILTLAPPKNSELVEDIIYMGNIDKIQITEDVKSKQAYAQKIIDTPEAVTYNLQSGEAYSANLDPVTIKYKTTPHLVFTLDYEIDSEGKSLVRTLPAVGDGEPWYTEYTKRLGGQARLFWKNAPMGAVSAYPTNRIIIPEGTKTFTNDYLYLANVKQTIIKESLFGGTSLSALMNNTWISCGKPVYKMKEGPIIISYTEGDTFYQRYDCLKTYPFTLEDENSITDITSFYCESYINLEGRYDVNRGKKNNLVMTPINFNLFNPVYSQRNNFFSSKILDPYISDTQYYPTSITWSKVKLATSHIDAWTTISLASNLDLDSDKGALQSIKKFNNDLYAFQNKGIAKLLFNSRVQIPTSEGVPIEIANSSKMDGKVYITTDLGCQNKWSICTTPNGIYFIDNMNHSLYMFNGSTLDPVSERLGFRTFFKDYIETQPWSPLTWKNFITHYDVTNDDLYFTLADKCLSFSELLNQFTSFYSYEKIPLMLSLDGNFYSLKNNNGNNDIWLHSAGDYNTFYGTSKGYYTTIIANQDPSIDKIITNIDLRSDMYTPTKELISNKTFDYLKIKNEYQNIEQNLMYTHGRPNCNLQKKFRIWRIQIGRDKQIVPGRQSDRIRNTWNMLTLGKHEGDKNRMVFYDMNLHYYV